MCHEQELIYLYHLGSQQAYDCLLEKYKKIIEKYFVVKYTGRFEGTQDDYVQLALIAFNKTLDHYRDDMNASMSTYFSYAIKDAMRSAVRNTRTQKHIPYDKLVALSDQVQGYVISERIEAYKPDVQMKHKEEIKACRQFINECGSTFERTVFDYLVYGYHFDEIAEILDVEVKKVYNAKYRILKKLEKLKNIQMDDIFDVL